MDRCGAVSRLGNRTDIDRTDLIGIRLCQDCLNYILSSGDIDFPCSLGIVVGGRRNHPADVEYIIGSRRAAKDIVVVRQVAPDDTHAVHLLVGCQLFLIDFAGTSQQGNIEAVAPLDKFLQSGSAHGAGGAGEEYSLLFCHNLRNYELWIMNEGAVLTSFIILLSVLISPALSPSSQTYAPTAPRAVRRRSGLSSRRRNRYRHRNVPC